MSQEDQPCSYLIMLCTNFHCKQISFFDNLQQALDEIPNESYVMLGDLNVRVGSNNSNAMLEDQWDKNRSPHGSGDANDAAKEFLHFYP